MWCWCCCLGSGRSSSMQPGGCVPLGRSGMVRACDSKGTQQHKVMARLCLRLGHLVVAFALRRRTPSGRGHACVRTRKLTHTQALRSLQTQAPPVPSRCFFRRQAVLGPRSWLVRPLRRQSVWLGRRSRIVGWYGVSRVLNRRQGGGGCCLARLLSSFRPSPGEPWCRLWCCCCCSVVRPQCRCGRTRSPLIASADR